MIDEIDWNLLLSDDADIISVNSGQRFVCYYGRMYS